jgi:muramoyltetrapeptide carboxypeptidase
MSAVTKRAPRLVAETVVGIAAPSSPASTQLIAQTRAFWEGRGHRVLTAPHVSGQLGGYLAGPPEDRAADLNEMINDPAIGIIVPAMGGKGASQLLPYIDYAAFAQSPAMFIGSSDTSILALALHAVTGVITFHGPTGMNYRGMPEYTKDSMLRALGGGQLPGPLAKAGPWCTARHGPEVAGPLLGGHLGTIRSLLGTPYEPDWDGSILFLEEIDTEFHDIDAALTHMRLCGVLDRISGLIMGRPVNVSERYWTSAEDLADVVRRVCAGTDFPIVMDADIGHTESRLTLPVGARAVLSPDRSALSIDGPVVE